MTKNHKVVFLFSGQGSQHHRMGVELYRTNQTFAASIRESDKLIQMHLNRSLTEELYDVASMFNEDDILFTNPAILAIELAILEVVEELGVTPDYVSGISLGEFAAAVAAGVWSKEMALETAIELAKSVVQSGVRGGMLAVIDGAKDVIVPLLDRHNLHIASENFPGHFTISGDSSHLDAFQQSLAKLDISFLRLPVSYPFHSPLIDQGKAGFLYYTFTAPALTNPSKIFVSGLYNEVRDVLPDDYFWKVASEPSDFISFVKYMETKGPCLYLDLGPSGTIATFVKYNLPESSDSITHTIMTPFHRDAEQLESLKALLGI